LRPLTHNVSAPNSVQYVSGANHDSNIQYVQAGANQRVINDDSVRYVSSGAVNVSGANQRVISNTVTQGTTKHLNERLVKTEVNELEHRIVDVKHHATTRP